jgi:hypothetical protein
MGFEELLNRIVEALDITIDRCPKGRPRKIENYTIEKIGCPYLNYPFLASSG